MGSLTSTYSALAPLAPDHEIAAQAIALAGFAKTYVQSVSESVLRLVGFGPSGSVWRTSDPTLPASRIAEALDGFAIEDHLPAGILRIHAGQDLHQRRLAGAVFTDQTMHRTPFDVE